MSDVHTEHDAYDQPDDVSYWAKHRLLALIVSAIIISLGLVTISLALYGSSGAAQLDLSRPGYRAVSSQAVKSEQTDKDFGNYAAFGPLDQASITEFKTLYDKQAGSAKAVDAFSGDPLDPVFLQINAPSTND